MVLLGAIDQGTSSTRFLVFESSTSELITSHQIEVKQLFPQAGWVEMDPNEIYSTVVDCIEQACVKLDFMGISKDEIQAVGISNQRETTVVWNKFTGEPLYNAIVWLDTRTSDLAEYFIKKTETRNKDYFKIKTGLPIHPYFSALKLNWLLNNVDEVVEALNENLLLFGTVDSWIIWKMTNGEHVTDITNASRTLLLDLYKHKWSTELCSFFNIPIEILPKIYSSAQIFGYINIGVLKSVPISGCVGDQQAAMIGHNCLLPGEGKNTYGTGSFILVNTGNSPVISKNGLLTTVGYQFGFDAPVCYALEGSGLIGGNAIRYLRDNLKFFNDYNEIEEIISSIKDTDGVYFVPCFSGLYTPYWDPTARGTICGLTLCSTRAHIILAALKAVAFQTVEMIEAIEKDLESQIKVRTLKIDGGMTINQTFNQIQADVLGREIICSKMSENSGWGAAVAAGIGIKLFSLEEYSRKLNVNKLISYSPKTTPEEQKKDLLKWKDALSRSRNWCHDPTS